MRIRHFSSLSTQKTCPTKLHSARRSGIRCSRCSEPSSCASWKGQWSLAVQREAVVVFVCHYKPLWKMQTRVGWDDYVICRSVRVFVVHCLLHWKLISTWSWFGGVLMFVLLKSSYSQQANRGDDHHIFRNFGLVVRSLCWRLFESQGRWTARLPRTSDRLTIASPRTAWELIS